MKKIKVSELFYSLQGEGRYVGTPSIFLRTFGCNFSCSGFGMPKGEKSQERFAIIPEEYLEYDQLPLVKTGCDSYASWDPRFKDLSPMLHVDEISSLIKAKLPYNKWGEVHLVITGGEPLLGWQKAFPELFNHSDQEKLKYVTFETNGTQSISSDVEDAFIDLDMAGVEFTFSVSPKLSCSGEAWEDAIKPGVIEQYERITNYNQGGRGSQVYLKFVVATEEDVQEVEKAHKALGSHLDVYLMPVGGTEESYCLNNKRVAQMALERGWKYSPRLQVDLWKNAWAT